MHRRFFIFFLSLLLAHVPLAFAPGGSDSENEDVPSCAPRKPSAQATEVAPESQRPAKRQRLNAEEATQKTVAVFQPTGQPSDQAGALPTAASDSPLDKLLILREVFQFLTIDEMKSCRLVCKKWHKAATYALSLQPRLRLILPPFATNPHAKTFLTHLQKNAAVKAWEAPDNPLPLTWNDDTPLVLEKLRPASVTLTLPAGVDLPVAHLASVRHLYLSAPQIPITFLDELAAMCLYTLNLSNQVLPTTLFSALARLPLTTLILEGVTLAIENREAEPSYYQAILQLRHLSTLTHLNLAQLQEEDNDEGLGDIIWHHTCQQLGLPDREDSLGTEHLQTLINNNPIHYLAHLETLNLEDAGFRGHWQFLANSAQTLKILNFCVKGASLGDAQQVPLYLLENLEELTTSSLDWFVGAEDQGVQHDNAPLLQSTSKLRVLDVKNSRIDNTHLRRLSTLQNVEELNVLSCRITSQPGADDESDLQQQGHVLLGQWPLKTLTAGFNLSLHCVPVFAQPLLLTHLSLKYCGLQSLEGLNPLVNLNHLDISNNDILVSESWRHMTNLKQLRVLEFSNHPPSAVLHTDAQAHAVCMQVLAQNTHLRKLKLAGQALGLEGACALTNLHCLENLYAGSCHLGDDGFKALPLSRLKTLDVADNNLTAESAKHLCETLQQVTLPHLNVLNLATNPLGDDAMEYLASIKSLQMLDVFYVGGTTAGMQKLVPLLPQLTCLFYDGNDLSAELNATFAAVNHNG